MPIGLWAMQVAMRIAPENQQRFTSWTLGLFALFLLAMLVDTVIRRMQREREAQEQLRRAEDHVLSHGVTPEDWAVMRGMLSRYAGKDVMRAVTERHAFDICVEEELAGLENDQNRYESVGTVLRHVRNRLGLDYVPFGHPIQSTREISVRHPIWVAPATEAKPNWVRARVLQATEAHFSVTPWPGEGGFPAIKPGQEVRCFLWREDDARYSFVTMLLWYEQEPAAWALHHTSELNRMQSREYYRAHVDQPTQVAVLASGNGGKDIHEAQVRNRYEGRISSLSGGGIAVLMEDSVPAGTNIRVSIKIPGEDVFDVFARVVDDEQLANRRRRMRAAFIDIEEEERDRVVRYVTLRQQMLLASEEHLDRTK